MAQTVVHVYQARNSVTLDGIVQGNEWSDTPIVTEQSSGLTYAFKQNGTGLLFLLIWEESAPCASVGCFGGIELGHMNNTSPMGSPSTPTLMILVSPAFTGGVDEFISTGEFTPVAVEQHGYKTQTTCGLNYAGGEYTAECYRPFKLSDASPYDFNFTIGAQAEIGFAVGLFDQPGNHLATDMSSFVLSIGNQTYTATSTSTASSSQSTTTSSSQGSPISPPGVPSVTYYAAELTLLVVGFSLVIAAALWRYRRR